MRQLYLTATALLVAGAFVACSSDDDAIQEQPAPEAGPVTISATITDEPASRIALGESTGTSTKVLWTDGDAFSLKIGEETTAYTFTTQLAEASATANFTCENAPTLAEGTTVTATYPATLPASYAEQPGTEEGLSQYLTLTATATATTGSYDNLSLSFKHNTSVVKLTLTNDAFKSAEVTDITLATAGWSVKTTSTFTGSENGNVTAYLVINSTDELTEATITATCGGANYGAALGGKTLTAGKLYKVTKPMEKVVDRLTASTVASESLSGEGTEDSPYLIQSAADLLYLSQKTDLGTTSENLYYRLTTDIEVASDVTWKPISEFLGTFDGNGKTISGTLATSGSTDGGVFGSLNGTVKNLNVSATITVSNSYGDLYVGGIVSFLRAAGVVEGSLQSAGIVEGCTFSGTITKMVGNVESATYVGGIAGQSYGTIRNCINTGTVNGPDAGYENYGGYIEDPSLPEYGYVSAYVGGIAGYVSSGTVYGCTHSGSVVKGNDCDNATANSNLYTGSIVGSAASGTVCSCNTATTDKDMAKVGDGSVSETCSHTTAE